MNQLPEWLKLVRGSLEDEDNEPVDVLLCEPIGFDPKTYDGISARTFGLVLSGIPKPKVINLQLNTMGGNVPEGVAMANMIMARGNVNTIVIGYAASMGAIIHQAGSVRKMMPGTMLVIHNPQADVHGDAGTLSAASEYVAQVKSNLVDMLAQRTKNSRRKISEMMDATTSMTPAEAKELNFVDEVIEGSPVWNNFDPKQFFESCRSLHGAVLGGGRPADRTTEENKMKKLMGVLATCKLVASPDLTDDQAAPAVETALGAINNNLSTITADRDRLKTENDKHISDRKARVLVAVENAITNKLVKPERKDALIAQGVADEAALTAHLADIAEVKGSATPPAPRRAGAPPVPPTQDNSNDADAKMKDLRNELKTANPVRSAEISKELRGLRGHTNLFAAPTATK